MTNYATFLASKHYRHEAHGFPTRPDDLPSFLFPHQRDLVAFALTKGRAALFADTGLGKSAMQLIWADEVARMSGGDVLILAPLAVAHQTVREGQRWGITVNYCRSQEGVRPGINITNYEMLDHFTPSALTGVVLDESSVLKAFSGKTRTALIEAFRETPYRLSSARNLAARYTADSGKAHYIVMGEIVEDDRETYYIGTAREVRKLKEAGFEVLE